MDVLMLHKIDEGLDSGEVAALKFLCRDHIPHKQLEGVQDGRNLFRRLAEQGYLEDGSVILADLLLTIRRFDLVKHLGHSRTQAEFLVQSQTGSDGTISSYRKMLYALSEEVTDENLSTFKFLLKIPRGRLEPCKSFLDVLTEMEKQELLSENHLSELQLMCQHCSTQLASRLQHYTAVREGNSVGNNDPSQDIFRPTYPDEHNFPRPQNQNQNQNQHQNHNPFAPSSSSLVPERRLSVSVDAGPVHVVEGVAVVTPEVQSSAYRMIRRPRGHCLIINNYNFQKARENGVNVNNRAGTDRDADDLTRVFTKLHFEVTARKDCTVQDMKDAVTEFGKWDHKELDAFVCCVLSHGEKGSVHGTDGELLAIRDLTYPFTSRRCPSLAAKPKLFFIQACQGQRLQPGMPIQADGEEVYQADAGSFQPDSIPDDADFLLAMATVEDFKSFRNIHQGSIFIQELCRQLLSGCGRNEDILTILTKVNQEVSRGTYLNSKQMPEPRFTLTKKLVLPFN